MARRKIDDYDVPPNEEIPDEKKESKRDLESRKLKEQIKALELKNQLLEKELNKPDEKNTNKGGRPEQYSKEFHPKLAELFYGLGGIDTGFAKFIGVTEPTIHNWKKKHKEFKDSVKLGKIDPDKKIIASLYKSALEGSNTAQIFWLKNRIPTEWREKQEIAIENITIGKPPDLDKAEFPE